MEMVVGVPFFAFFLSGFFAWGVLTFKETFLSMCSISLSATLVEFARVEGPGDTNEVPSCGGLAHCCSWAFINLPFLHYVPTGLV